MLDEDIATLKKKIQTNDEMQLATFSSIKLLEKVRKNKAYLAGCIYDIKQYRKIELEYNIVNQEISEEYHYNQNLIWKTWLYIEILLPLRITSGCSDLDDFLRNHSKSFVSNFTYCH